MCYVVYLSTSCSADLSPYNTHLLRLSQEQTPEPAAAVLLHPHQWFVGSESGCSCAFRHTMDAALGFGPPEDWMPEETSNIEATVQFFRLVQRLRKDGHDVDCVDAWSGTAAGSMKHLSLNTNDLAEGDFRFFENYHFTFL